MSAPREIIRSRSNAFVRRLRSLEDRGAEEGLALLEGPKLLEEALSSGVEVVEAAAAPRVEKSARGQRLIRELEAAGTVVRWVHDEVLETLSEAEASQGIVALARRPTFQREQLVRGKPLVVVMAGLQNPGNVGGLMRSAEAAGATGACLTTGTADPFSWKALRGSMGSAFRLPHLRQGELHQEVAWLKQQGLAMVACVADGVQRYDEADLRRPLAFLFGNEAAGLPEDVIRSADVQVSIPMLGSVESLNVGVAAGILLFEAARQRRH
jgi:TrmH family RNA methyltransferase